MKLIKLAGLALLLVFGPAIADDVEKEMKIKVVVAGDGGDQAFDWSSDSADFSLEDLAVGESKTLENDDGEPITITRTEEGFTFDINGESVSLPGLGEHGPHMAFIDAEGAHKEVDVRVIRMPADAVNVEVVGGHAEVMRAHHGEGITIIAGEPLDESVKESIRSVLISAGRDDEVVFIDGSGEGKHVRIIRKQVEVGQ